MKHIPHRYHLVDSQRGNLEVDPMPYPSRRHAEHAARAVAADHRDAGDRVRGNARRGYAYATADPDPAGWYPYGTIKITRCDWAACPAGVDF